MTRLIDADDFLKWLDVGHLRNPGEVCFCEADVAHMIKSRATIDPVHAAGACYCWECKHLLRDLSSREYHMCMRLRLPQKVDLDDFCSYGQRLEE